MESAPSINRIHVNSSTGLSLNERFTAMQTFGPNIQTKPKIHNSSRFKLNGNGSAANKKFLQQLEKKHKLEAALKLKRRSLKAGLIQRGRGRNRNINALALHLSQSGKIIKARSLANVATMKADLVQPVALKRSNSGLNLTGRIGLPRRINRRRASQIGIIPQGGRRMRIRQIATSKNNNIHQNQIRGRSRSRSRTRQRSNSVSNFTRRNSAPNVIQQQQQQQLQQRIRSRSRSRGRLNTNIMNRNNRSGSQSRPVHSRLGIKRVPVKNNIRGLNNRRGGHTARGRIVKTRNSIGQASINSIRMNQNNIKRQGRSRSRSRVRNGATVQGQRGRSRSRARSQSIKRGGKTQIRGSTANRRGRSRSRVRGGRGPTRGGNNTGKREDIKKEDLDKELDQYMSLSTLDNNF